MPSYSCKECGKILNEEDEKELMEKTHTHLHFDHGKHVSKRKIRRQLE